MKQKKKVVIYFGVSGHGKGLVNVMSGFGVKGPLKKAVLTEDFSFSSAEDIYNYVQERFQFDTKKNHFLFSVESIAENRKFDGSLKIEGCRDIHMIAFSPDGTVATKINICSCSSGIIGEFQECLEEKGKLIFHKYNESSDSDSEDDGCEPEESDDTESELFELRSENIFSIISKGSVIALYTSFELFYLCKVVDCGIASENLIDQNEHVVPVGARYIKCKYFEKKQEEKCCVYYNLLHYDVYVLPTQVMSPLVKLNEDNSLSIEEYQWLADSI